MLTNPFFSAVLVLLRFVASIFAQLTSKFTAKYITTLVLTLQAPGTPGTGDLVQFAALNISANPPVPSVRGSC